MHVTSPPLTVSHLWQLLRRAKRQIISITLFMGIIGLFWGFTRPIRYSAEGTFRDKGMVPAMSAPSSMLQLLQLGTREGGREATALMTSRYLLQKVVEDLHLQGHLESIPSRESIGKRIQHNSALTWQEWVNRSPFPTLQDESLPIRLTQLDYTGETPLFLFVDLTESGDYTLRFQTSPHDIIGEGHLGNPLHAPPFTLVLADAGKNQLKTERFSLVLYPMASTIKYVIKHLQVESFKGDSSFLRIRYRHRDRHLASNVVNQLMHYYQSYLHDYHKTTAETQLNYLQQRQHYLMQRLSEAMNRHAEALNRDLSHSGFLESTKEMEFLSQQHHAYKELLQAHDLEMGRLRHLPIDLLVFDEGKRNADRSDMQAIVTELRTLRHERDALAMALQKKNAERENSSFSQQLQQLDEVEKELQMVQALSHVPDTHLLPSLLASPLYGEGRLRFVEWAERLQREGDNRERREQFFSYLSYVAHLLEVQARLLREQLTHSHLPPDEYQGMTLEVARQLYLDYATQLVHIEGTIRESLFLIQQLALPEFEITSLSATLTDPISQQMIQKGSDLLLHIRDQHNQSAREQERNKEELQLYRTLLALHLTQRVDLLELQKHLLEEKIASLQAMTLELMHRRLSLLEKTLKEQRQARLSGLEQEKHLIRAQLQELREEMAHLPQRWVSEQLIAQEVEMNQRIVEEIVKLVESKNIAHHLDLIHAAPLDAAFPPLHPLPSQGILFGLLGLILGALGGSLIALRGANPYA